MTTETSNARDVHTCSYTCERPACIRAQRDELASRLAAAPPPAAARGDVRGLVTEWERDALVNVLSQGERAVLRNCTSALRKALAAEGVQAGEVEQRAREFDFAAHLARQREWSGATFGPGARTAGVCDHIRKELREIEAAPNDGEEWIDVVILALDGAWRCGMTPQQIIDGIVAKQAKNECRAWPDWRTSDPNKAIEHDRSGEQQPEARGVVGELVQMGDDEDGHPRLIINTTREAIKASNLVPFSQVEVRNG